MQKGFEQNPKKSPKHWQNTLRLGKVIGAKADEKTVDITMVNGGAVFHDVPVLVDMISTSSGKSYLPKPENPKADTEEGYDFPETYGGRDIFAIIGFVEGIGTMPVVLGFRSPEENQMSFSNNVGANQYLERHESDRYHRIIGDTVESNGGEDVSGEEEIRYPDNSYFKVVKNGGSRALENLGTQNKDADTKPFKVKKDERKGYYFQHSSGTNVYIGEDGEIKIGHHTGSWISIAESTDELAAETVSIQSEDSENDPPTAAPSDTVQIHVEHSSGAKFTIMTDGKIRVDAAATVEIAGTIDAIVKGVIQGDCICALTGRPHIMTSATVKASM